MGLQEIWYGALLGYHWYRRGVTDKPSVQGRLQEALALRSVPPLSYQLGLAGTIPYFLTSLSTVYLSWDINTEWPSQSQFLNHIMISHEQATHYLHLLEPIQVGYGAVIISFLGAIHWVRQPLASIIDDHHVTDGLYLGP